MFLIDSIEQKKVSHGPHIDVNQDNVLHLPASAVQLTWIQTLHYIVKQVVELQFVNEASII